MVRFEPSSCSVGSLLVVTTTLLVVLATGAPTAAAADGGTVSVTQGDRCLELQTLGDGSRNVSEFYDYRAGTGTQYSSYGTTALQQSQVSQLFVYDGREGLSVVVLHDELSDGQGGGVVSMELSGLPEGGRWVVEDDRYPARDDVFDHGGTTSSIDWFWGRNRTDGAAFRGLALAGPDGITIEPGFNEDADYWNSSWRWSTNRTDAWLARSGTGETTELDMDAPVTVHAGHCPGTAPNASLDAPATVEAGATVTLDASGSTDDGGIADYRWDVDGDGEIDATGNVTVETSYAATGSYEPRVTVVDDAGQTDTASAVVDVTDDTPPTAVLDAPDGATAGEPVTFSAVNSTDNGELAAYEWSFGDDTTASGETVSHTYATSGTYEVTLTVTDAAGNEATATVSVAVSAPDTTPPTAVLSVPDQVPVTETVTLDASGSADDRGIVDYRWDVDGDGGIDASGNATVDASYDDLGTTSVSVTVVDAAGNTNTTARTVNVTDDVAPTASFDAPSTASTGSSVPFDAAASTDNHRIDSYVWSFGDGATASGETVSHTYATSGTYEVTLTVTDAAGNDATATATISVGTEGGAGAGSGTGGDDGGDGTDEGTSGGSDGGTTDGGGNAPGSVSGGGSGGGTSVTTVSTSSPPPRPQVDATVDDDGRVTVTARRLTAGERVGVDLPAFGSTPARFSRLSFTPTRDSDRLSVTLAPTNASGVPVDRRLGGVEVQSGTDALSSVAGLRYEFTVPESTTVAGDVALYTLHNGTWTRTTPSVVEVADGRVRFRSSAPVSGPVVVGLRQPNVSVASVTTNTTRAVAGDTVRLRARVVNTGRLNGTETLSFSVDGDPVAERTVTVPAAGERTVTVRYRFPTNGSYALAVGARTATVRVAPRAPSFGVTDVSVSPTSVAPGESVVVTAAVTNDGTAAGQYEASLRLFGEVVAVTQVRVPPGERRTVTFRRQVVAPGTYTAAVGNRSVEFTVVGTPTATQSPTSTGGPGFGPVVGVVALLLAGLALRWCRP